MRIQCYVLLLTFLVLGCSRENKDRFDLVIHNGSVIDLETGNIAKQTIFITDGRIKKLRDSNTKIAFSAEQTLDAQGKFILPGLWDNHVHFRGGDSLIAANKNFLNLFIANGITTVRDTGGDLTTSVLDWRKQIAAGSLVGPTIFTSGPKIDGAKGTWAGSLEVVSEPDVKTVLDSL